MKIKSLLLGSAAASMLAVSGAQAADPIIYAEPEPMEYVRICDIYGAGFYYIPGTETCLKIGGYVRMELRHLGARNDVFIGDADDADDFIDDLNDAGIPFTDFGLDDGNVWVGYPRASRYNSFVRAAPTWDARSETEWGTLRAFIQVHFDYLSGTGSVPFNPELEQAASLGGGSTSAYIDHAFIELGGLRMGVTDLIYARELGYGAGGVFGAVYGFGNDTEISYTFRHQGFTVAASMVENHDGNWAPDFQGVVKYDFGGNSIGAGATYDNVNNRWTAKGVARMAIPNIGGSLGLHVFYTETNGLALSSNSNRWGIASPATSLLTPWSVLANATVPVTPELSVKGHVQWYQETAGFSNTWDFVAGLNWQPVSGFNVQPEIRHVRNAEMGNYTNATIRFQRSF